ncbi:hypothetical protein, partial [Salmonella sp. s55884]|uniref:hypothetical protein n=1 Tax=Salmonella sp. s55884 TaxID=3159683 RepID=UPI00397F6912
KQNPKQQILSRNTLPTTMQEQYNRCDPPPPLQLITPLRDDSKDALKLYTDPSYFINLWIDNENKDYEQRRKRHKERKERKRRNETAKEASVV